MTVVELTPEGDRLARRFIDALEFQTEALRAGWPAQREPLTIDVLNEICDALEAGKQPPQRRRRPASRTLAHRKTLST